MNYTNPTSGPIFKQLYIRQAMQSLMNQTLWIQLYDGGYGVPDLRSGAGVPADKLRLAAGELNPYPYKPSAREGVAQLPRLERSSRTASAPV